MLVIGWAMLRLIMNAGNACHREATERGIVSQRRVGIGCALRIKTRGGCVFGISGQRCIGLGQFRFYGSTIGRLDLECLDFG
jgi:hypothetical protein